MKKSIIVAAIGFLAMPASAQQPQVKSPSEAAIDVCNEVGLISRWAEQQQRTLMQLQAENAQLKKQLEAPKPADAEKKH